MKHECIEYWDPSEMVEPDIPEGAATLALLENEQTGKMAIKADVRKADVRDDKLVRYLVSELTGELDDEPTWPMGQLGRWSSGMADEIIIVVDVETTGFDASRHEIIDLWAVALDARTLDVRWQDGGLVRPRHIETASEKALEINRYDAERWELAESFAEVWNRIASHYELSKIAWLAGHNTGFDAKFIDFAMTQHGLPAIAWLNYGLIDTASLAMPAKQAGFIQGRSLRDLAWFYIPSCLVQAHWPTKLRHGAKADARITAAVLMTQLSQNLQWTREIEKSIWPDDDPVLPEHKFMSTF